MIKVPDTETSKEQEPAVREDSSHSREELQEIFYQLVGRRPGSMIKPAIWLLGSLLLAIALFFQYAYFHRDQLAKHPDYGDMVLATCGRLAHLGCQIRAPRDVGRIELTHTSVKPHPKYEKVLRVRATLVNRANFSQPFPLMEISLSNRLGGVATRRVFGAEHYLNDKKKAQQLMSVNVATSALLDITNLNSKTQGYEIRLVAWD